MSNPNVRLAFQGGGAKLIAMLPVAHAFSDAHGDEDIVITAVSGTSAGAICAGLVAARADFEAVRAHIVAKGPAHLSALVPPRIASLASKVRATQSLGLYNIVRNLDIVKHVALDGRPLLNGPELTKFVEDLFKLKATKHISTLDECPIPIAITTSDIVRSQGVTQRSGPLVTAITDSCFLPILLRSFDALRESHYVDGGLCDNLPVESLMGDHQDPIFAVFPKTRDTRLGIRNILTYISSLLAASIGHSVQRSVSMVSRPFQFEIDTDLGLLDFEAAIARLADDHWYEHERGEAAERLQDFTMTYGYALSPNEARVIDVVDVGNYQRTLSNIIGKYPSPLECTSAKFIVRVNSDEHYKEEREALHRRADTITRVVRLKVGASIPAYYRSHVNIVEDNIVPTIWSVKNITRGIEIPIQALPLEKRELDGFSARECLLEFFEPAKHMEPDDTIEIQCIYHTVYGRDMRELNFGKTDFIAFDNARDEVIPVADVILIYPMRLGRLSLLFDAQRSKGIASPPTAMIFDMDDKTFAGHMNDVVGFTLRDFRPGAKLWASVVVTGRR